MVASREIKQGELIFENEPIAVGPNQNAKSICLGCYAQVNVLSMLDRLLYVLCLMTF